MFAALGLKNLAPEHYKHAEQHIQLCKGSVFAKLYDYYWAEHLRQSKLPSAKAPGGGPAKPGLIFSKPKDLALLEDPEMQNFFRSMCVSDAGSSIKHAKLDRPVFKQFLQDRYSKLVGEKLLQHIENSINPLYRADYPSFLQVIIGILNAGPDCYKRMLFASLSLTNPGRICEHDIFTLMEQFRQRESFFFYQDLISQSDVPRDFQKLLDDSDKIFFEAFVRDVKVIAHFINMRKRMAGIVDMDTVSGVEDDFNEAKYPGSPEQCVYAAMNQVDHIMGVINKRGGGNLASEVVDVVADSVSVQELRNKLCSLVAEHGLVQPRQGAPKRQQSALSNTSGRERQTSGGKQTPGDGGQGAAGTASNFFKSSQNVTPCLGPSVNARSGKKVASDCVYLTYEDFDELTKAGRPGADSRLSSLAIDFVKTVTLGRIDLAKFEAEMAHHRDSGSGGFQGVYHGVPRPEGQFSQDFKPRSTGGFGAAAGTQQSFHAAKGGQQTQ